MTSVSVSHADTCVSLDCDDDGYHPDVIDDMCKQATRALYAAHCWITGQVQHKP